MRRLLIVVAALILTACASVPGKYSAPEAGDSHALIKAVSKLNQSATQAKSGWQMPGMAAGTNYNVILFQVDGNKITKVGGVKEVRVEPGKHQVQVLVDNGLIPLSGDLSGQFKEGHVYDVNVYSDDQGKFRYRAELVDENAPSDVVDKVRF